MLEVENQLLDTNFEGRDFGHFPIPQDIGQGHCRSRNQGAVTIPGHGHRWLSPLLTRELTAYFVPGVPQPETTRMTRAIINIVAVYSKDKVLMRLVEFFMVILSDLIV